MVGQVLELLNLMWALTPLQDWPTWINREIIQLVLFSRVTSMGVGKLFMLVEALLEIRPQYWTIQWQKHGRKVIFSNSQDKKAGKDLTKWHLMTVRRLPGDYLVTDRKLDNCSLTTQWLPNDHLMTAKKWINTHLMTTHQLPDNHPTALRWPYDDCWLPKDFAILTEAPPIVFNIN